MINLVLLVIFYTCAILYYAIGFGLALCWGLKHRWQNRDSDCKFSHIFKVLPICTIPVIGCFDFISDVSIARLWLSENKTRTLGLISVYIIVQQRIISAMVLGDKDGWRAGMLQLFDLEVFYGIYRSVRYERQVYGLMKYKILEGILESFPQLLLQMYVFVNSQDDEKSGFLLQHISIVTSLISLTTTYLLFDVISVVGRFTYLKYSFLAIWRVGELATRISIIAAFASLISARLGTTLIILILLIWNYCLLWLYNKDNKATVFYSQHKLKDLTTYSLTTKTLSTVSASTPLTEHEINKMDKRLLSSPEREDKSQKIWSWIETFALGLISEIGEAFFGVPALPWLGPRRLVQLYYLFKFIFEGFLIATCVYYSEGIKTANNILDLIHILSDEVFSDIWPYWIIGLFCLTFGGALSFSSMDAKRWSDVMDGSEDFLVELMKDKKFSFVERALENGEGSILKIIRLAIDELEDNHRSHERSFSSKKHCKLLLNMLQNGIIRLGPRCRLTKEEVKKLKYRKFLIPALLTRCNERWRIGKRQMLAKLLCDKLRMTDKDHKTLYIRIRNAGASLTFLRFHLQVDDKFFEKGGVFQCEAQELVQEKFDILYCLKCGFSRTELKSCFKEVEDDHEVFNKENLTLEMLKDSKEKLFAMNFTVRTLKMSGHFTDRDIKEWYFKYIESEQTTRYSEDEFTGNRGISNLLDVRKNISKSLSPK